MKLKNILILCIVLLSAVPFVYADSSPLDDEISDEDREKFDEILEPIMKIYNFIKYIASVVAAIFLLFAGISYMTSGTDPKKRDQAKSIATYVIIGLIIIWATPMIISLLV